MRAWGHDMTWWARTAQKSGSRLLPHAAVPVWLSPASRDRAMAPGQIGPIWSTVGKLDYVNGS